MKIVITMIVVLIVFFLLLSCSVGPSYQERRQAEKIKLNAIEGPNMDLFYTIEIDKCEYVIWDTGSSHGGAMVHKANCKNHK